MTSIFLSKRPGLKRAESNISGLLVAEITIIPELSEKPSSSVNS